MLTDGFDWAGSGCPLNTKWGQNSGTAAFDVAGRFGGRAMRGGNDGNTAGMNRLLPVAEQSASFRCGFSYRWPNTGFIDSIICTFQEGSTVHIDIRQNANGTISVTRNGMVLQTSTNALMVNTWYYLEITGVIDDSAGACHVEVEGASTGWINLTGADTKNGGTGVINRWDFRFISGSTSSQRDIDDWNYEGGVTTMRGPGKIETLVANSDVSVALTPNSGVTNYTQVDDAPSDGDTTYVSGATGKDTYGFTNLTSTPAIIHAVKAFMVSRKDDATARTVRQNLTSGPTTHNGPDHIQLGTYTCFDSDVLLLDPNTSAGWTASGVNALEGGPEITS